MLLRHTRHACASRGGIKMERIELIELVKEIQSSSGTEEEVDNLVNTFIRNVQDPNALDYLYSKQYEDLTPEEIVDKVLNYKPFQL